MPLYFVSIMGIYVDNNQTLPIFEGAVLAPSEQGALKAAWATRPLLKHIEGSLYDFNGLQINIPKDSAYVDEFAGYLLRRVLVADTGQYITPELDEARRALAHIGNQEVNT